MIARRPDQLSIMQQAGCECPGRYQVWLSCQRAYTAVKSRLQTE